MQKVSKQSLAMIALSILLAISIALTFTFAALQDSKTATGTITFSGSASVEWKYEGTDTKDYVVVAEGSDKGNIGITLRAKDFKFVYSDDGLVAKLSEATLTEFEKVTVTINNGTSGTLAWTVETDAGMMSGGLVTTWEDSYTVNPEYADGEVTAAEGSKTITLKQLIGEMTVGYSEAEDMATLGFWVTVSIKPTKL